MNLGQSGASCSECGADTPKKVYLCTSCINFDPDYGDYRTEWEIWDEEEFRKDMEFMLRIEAEREAEQTALEEFEDQLWVEMMDNIRGDLDFYNDYLSHEDEVNDAYWAEIVTAGSN